MNCVLVLCVSILSVVSSAGFDLRSILDHALDVYAPVSQELGDGACRAHGLFYKQAVKDGQVWALNMFDAGSKLPSGVLTGNLVQMGNYEQCLGVEHVHPTLGSITGQHCMVALGSNNSLFTQPTMTDKFQGYREHFSQKEHFEKLLRENETTEAFVRLGATLSVCVPAACTPGELQVHLRSALRGWLGDAVNVTVHGSACNSKAAPTAALTKNAMLAIILVSCFLALILLGTAYDLLKGAGGQNSVLLALSVRANAVALMAPSKSTSALPVLDGIRVLSILWVVLYHHYRFNLTNASINFNTVMQVETDWKHMAISNGSLCVDSFLLLAGTLLAYNFLRDRSKGLEFNFTRFYAQRYIRVAPAMLGVSLVTLILTNMAGGSPLVKANAALVEDACDNIWWQFLFISNYVPSDPKCVGVTWYLSMDMQLVWIAPLLLFPLWRWPRVGKSIIGLVFAAGITTVFAVAYANEVAISKYILPRVNEESLLLLPTHARITPWLLGLLLGNVLHFGSHTWSTRRTSWSLVGVAWTSSLALLATSLLYAHRFYASCEPFDGLSNALYLAMMRPAWALGLAGLVGICVTGHGGCVNTLLSWTGWLVPSRLTFCVYLTHWTLLAGFHTTLTHTRHFDDMSMVVEFLGLSMFSFAAALLLHLLCEAPATALGKLLLDQIIERPVNSESSKKQEASSIREDGIVLESPAPKIRNLRNLKEV